MISACGNSAPQVAEYAAVPAGKIEDPRRRSEVIEHAGDGSPDREHRGTTDREIMIYRRRRTSRHAVRSSDRVGDSLNSRPYSQRFPPPWPAFNRHPAASSRQVCPGCRNTKRNHGRNNGSRLTSASVHRYCGLNRHARGSHARSAPSPPWACSRPARALTARSAPSFFGA